MTLEELYNSTPYLNSSDKGTVHSYIQHFYEKEFAKYKDSKISILEIGTFKGASLALYKAYFTNATITGIDGNDWVEPENRDPDINYIVVETAYSKEVADTLDKFDIIIDDASHELHHQISAIELYLPKLKKGGLFIIEDIEKDDYLDKLVSCVPDSYLVETIDLRDIKGRYDDLMLTIRW